MANRLSHSPNFKKIYPHQFPGAGGFRKYQHGGSRLFSAELLSRQAHIGGSSIQVNLFSTQHSRLPDLRLRSHHAADESH